MHFIHHKLAVAHGTRLRTLLPLDKLYTFYKIDIDDVNRVLKLVWKLLKVIVNMAIPEFNTYKKLN